MPNFGSAIQTNKIPVKGLTPEASGTAPSAPVTGQLWVDTSTSPPTVKYWNATAWIRANGQDIPAGTIGNAQISPSAAIALSKLATDPLARANHTGSQPSSTISDLATVVKAYRVDEFAAPTGSVNLNSQKIVSLLDPTGAQDAATKQYVDNARSGISGVKDPVRLAVQTNVNLTSPGATLDGLTLASGDRFLAAGQTTASQNGLYVWNGAATAATRSLDANTTGEIVDGTLVAVAEGTYAGSQYIQTAVASGAPGAWTQTWTVYTTAGTSYVGGAGMVLSGATFNIAAADGSITVNADDITVGLVPLTKGGTGATSAATARTALGVGTTYAADLGALTAGTPVTVTHNLGTLDVQTTFYEKATGADIELEVTSRPDVNSITVRADIAVSASAIRVVVRS